jgi:flagellar hook protein FlgE
MSIFSAINSSLSGLNAQSAALGSISNNIANASTVGYKQSQTDFDSLVDSSSVSGASSVGGVTTSTALDISTAGQVQTTGVSTDLAINGNGFMVVSTDATAGSGNTLLTRAGSFRPDANGNLVNAAGYFLQGQALNAQGDPVSPTSSLSSLSTVNVSNLSATGSPTTAITFMANLPSSETAYAATTPAPSSSSVSYYNALGTQQSLQFQFTPTVPATAGSANSNTWTMNIYDTLSATPATPIGSATLTFNGSGNDAGTLASVSPIGGAGSYDSVAGTYTIATASGQNIPIDIGALNSSSGMTQFSNCYQTTQVSQNGAGFGVLQSVAVGNNGTVTASFSNGASRPIYQVDLVTVPNPDGLTPVSGDAYQLSDAAGVPQIVKPGAGSAGTIDAGALEGSNVDITTQLTNMIETQRAYQSNAMVLQTSSQMLDTINRLNA